MAGETTQFQHAGDKGMTLVVLSRGQLTSYDSPDPTCKLTKLSRQETKELQQSAENSGERVTETLVVQANQGEEAQLPEKTSKEVALWQRLHEVLEQEPKFNMVAKQEDIMAILEGVEPSSPEGTLQYWLMEHMYQTLTNEEDDTIVVPGSHPRHLGAAKNPTDRGEGCQVCPSECNLIQVRGENMVV